MFQQALQRLIRRSAWALGLCLAAPALSVAFAQNDHELLIADYVTNGVKVINWPDAGPATVLVPSGSNGLDWPSSMTIGPDCRLYVASYDNTQINVYLRDGSFSQTLQLPVINSVQYQRPYDVVFGPRDGKLYVSTNWPRDVLRYDLELGTWEKFIATPTFSGAGYMVFTPEHQLVISDFLQGKLYTCDPATGVHSVIPTAVGLGAPENLALGPNGDLFVCEYTGHKVSRFPKSGASFSPRVLVTSLAQPHGLAFTPEGKLLIASYASQEIRKYDVPAAGAGATYLATFSSGHRTQALLFASRASEFPLHRGEIVATYCPELLGGPGGGPDPLGAAVKIIDPDVVPFPNLGVNTAAPMFSNQHAAPQHRWNFQNLGAVFGVTIDHYAPQSIYVAASKAYGLYAMPQGPGAVFKLDGATGNISLFASLPNTGSALGDVEWNRHHERLYVSNFEDGRIYSYDKNGVLKQVFDPFGLGDANNNGIIPLSSGGRVWALKVNSKRLLTFSVWLRDNGRRDTAWPAAWGPQPWNVPEANNALFVVTIAADGMLTGPALLRRVLPRTSSDGANNYSNPVSDIDALESIVNPAQATRTLLVGERTMSSDVGQLGYGHSARMLQVTLANGSWFFGYDIGDHAGPGFLSDNAPEWYYANCAGGAAYDRRGNLWASGDALLRDFTGPIDNVIYGLQRIPFTGNATWSSPISQSMLIDLSSDTLDADKAQQGDVEWCAGAVPLLPPSEI